MKHSISFAYNTNLTKLDVYHNIIFYNITTNHIYVYIFIIISISINKITIYLKSNPLLGAKTVYNL